MTHPKTKTLSPAILALAAAGVSTSLSSNLAAAPTTASEKNLVAHWTFDNPENLGEDSGPAKKFHATGGATQVKPAEGLFGGAAEFKQPTEKAPSAQAQAKAKHKLPVKNILTAPDATLPDDLRELTFSAWVKIAKFPARNATILRKEDGATRLLFGFQEGKFLTLGINCGRNYHELKSLVSPEDFTDGNWHYIAASFDGKHMRTYLDGREIGNLERQAPLNTSRDYISGRHNAPFAIGSSEDGEAFTGLIDDLRFYSRALSISEIQATAAKAKQAVNPKIEKARKIAKNLYKKGNSLAETLAKLDTSAIAKQLPIAKIELHRLLSADFSEEVNNYVFKHRQSPLNLIALSKPARRDLLNSISREAFEYLPLTDFQWKALSKKELAKWNEAKALKAKFDNGNATFTAAEIYKLQDLVNERPKVSERVADYVVPQTPVTKDRTAQEAREVIERDWLFQCNQKPTVQRSLQEIGYTRSLAARLNIAVPAALDELEKQAQAKAKETFDQDLYFAIRTIKREITFKNPVLDFDSVLYIDNPMPSGREREHETRHRLGYMGVPGGRLIVQKGLSPDGQMRQLLPQAPLHGTFWRPDLSFDATKALVSYKPHNEKTFHLYEIGLDGSGFRQLTSGMFDDLDPIYLPDGKNILFTTTRGYLYVRCMPPTNAMVTARMSLNTKPGDKTIYITSRNGEPEYTPSVMQDGRIIYTRWEYTDKPLWRAQKLWTMNQDTTNVQTFWGNQSVWPDLLKDARNIPGSNRVMFTGSAHHNWFAGSIGIIDPSKGINFPHGLTKVTQEIHYPESGNGPVDPKENNTYHVSGNYRAYYSPYPLSEKEFLVSANRNGKFVLLFMDTDGNREIINEGAHNIWDAIPIRKRQIRTTPDLVNWPTWETRDKPETGLIYSNNVYENAPPELKDKAKYLRIWSIEHKTYTYWYKRPHISTGPEISINQSDGVKKIIGTVPVEADGSVNFNAPAGVALHFQLLDKDFRALQTMKSFTGVQPGETRACFGCHEQKMNAVGSKAMSLAMRKPPANITPVPWTDISVGYERYVQTGLDQYCSGCHAETGTAAHKKFNSALRPGFLGFKEPYRHLLGAPAWGRDYSMPENRMDGFGWADTIHVESYSGVAPAAYATYPAMTKLSYKSRLVKRFAGEPVFPGDKHPVIKADPEAIHRVILWVDAMGPYYGAEEVREMEDPKFPGRDWISQPPRIHTAPIVQRPGPFDAFHTDEDPAYFPPKPAQYNALPYGVTRK